MSTITRTNVTGLTAAKTGDRLSLSHSETPKSAFPRKEPSPMMDAMNIKVGQLTALTASAQARIGLPSRLYEIHYEQRGQRRGGSYLSCRGTRPPPARHSR